MSLKELNFRSSYNTSESDIIKDFFTPAFENSTRYKRGVGYFTSGWLSQNAKGLAKFIENGGKAQYITSPILDKNDLEALQGKFDPSLLDKKILKNISVLEKELEENTKNLLGWLVYDGLLEFRFAIPRYNLEGGDFHDKFGVFIDEENNMVAFIGSINETMKGFLNYESITVFCLWKDDTSKNFCIETYKRFQNLWENKDPNIMVYEINDIIKNKLFELKSYSRPYKKPSQNLMIANYLPSIPPDFEIRTYQKEAIKAWLKNNGRGILSMATGSGKTKTALYTIVKLLEEIKSLPVLIVVPYKHLLEQWYIEAKEFNIELIRCNSDYPNWQKELSTKITNNLLNKKPVFAITTNNTYKSKKFQSLINRLNNLFLIVDEVHNFGSKEIKENYLDNAKFRLGLSATPQRHFDEEGTKALLNYFGKIVYEFTLKEAIDNGYLTEYYYHPIFVYLTEEEEKEYIALSEKISQFRPINEDNEENIPGFLKMLLIKRAKIIESAQNKIHKLKEILTKNNLINSKKNLFYVSSEIEYKNDKKIRNIDKYTNLLRSLGMNVEPFTALEDKWQRNNLIMKLENDLIDGLVAIKCLDEGVDIPSVRRAFILSSSSNPKEFIQRRGRILRKSPGKKYAHIYDFLVIPRGADIENFEYERKYLERELRRFQEFAKLAKNSLEAESQIFEIKKQYNLLHI
ncbi:DNA phosphorothioation system restriction enzyme [Nitratiruptor sp. SB155-2]|uniref:DNA phosphorothioation system restriction enzyme n=1 Tax=Nitratiruptor sp. (strain SB155-2) TaxID=387092 RepID=UPI0001587407|nr:DNA phosphorothioation system restriction enzyme [Nitratiruptor sp. SB155-2]BAF70781.1 conserved hypothetical protein [Nitratiruptor sp. SB155-2]